MSNQSKEYWDTVRSLAECIVDECEDQDEFYDRAFEIVDGSSYVIFYSKNMVVLQCSNNDGAFEDQGIELETSRGWRHILTQVAFWAMLQDVMEALEMIIDEREENNE